MKDDQQPLVRVKSDSGIVYYPRFEKNTEGEWMPTDPSFQATNRRRFDSEKREGESRERREFEKPTRF